MITMLPSSCFYLLIRSIESISVLSDLFSLCFPETVIGNYTIEVGRPQTDGSITYQTCRHFEKTTNSVLKAACNNVVVGQYVRIMKLDRQDKDPLTLCEVEVYGICLSKCEYSYKQAIRRVQLPHQDSKLLETDNYHPDNRAGYTRAKQICQV